MVAIVTSRNKHRHLSAVDSMHRDRKSIFVDKLKWNVPVVDGDKEVDQFDTEHAVYLMAAGDDGAHLGSVRLLPTTRPHLLGEVFRDLVEGELPTGERIWELTRLVTAPHLHRTPEQMMVMARLSAAILEFGQIAGIDMYTGVTHSAFLPVMVSLPWNCEPLGLPRNVDGVGLCAVSIKVEERARASFRDMFQLPERAIDSGWEALPMAA